MILRFHLEPCPFLIARLLGELARQGYAAREITYVSSDDVTDLSVTLPAGIAQRFSFESVIERLRALVGVIDLEVILASG